MQAVRTEHARRSLAKSQYLILRPFFLALKLQLVLPNKTNWIVISVDK